MYSTPQLASIKIPARANEHIKSNGLSSTQMTSVFLPLLSVEPHILFLLVLRPFSWILLLSSLRLSRLIVKPLLLPLLSFPSESRVSSWPQLPSTLMTLKSESPSPTHLPIRCCHLDLRARSARVHNQIYGLPCLSGGRLDSASCSFPIPNRS